MQRVDFLARTDLFGIDLSMAHWSGPSHARGVGVIFEGAQRIQKLNLATKARSHCLTAGSSTAGNNRDPRERVNSTASR